MQICCYPVPPLGGQHGLAFLHHNWWRLFSNLLNLHPLSIGRLQPGWVQLLVRGGRSHGYQGEKKCKHFGGRRSKGNDGARDSRNLKYPTLADPVLRIVVACVFSKR